MQKKVIFTVDVEGHVGDDPVSKLIYGKTDDGKMCGIDLLMDLLDEFGFKGLFFVDVAGAWDYGKERISEVIQHIKNRGHDVGVHIHPDHFPRNSKLFLFDYSFEEKKEMIENCTEFYKEVLGDYPKAFRAGKYSADIDTLQILSNLNYKADFSEFVGQKWCGIKPDCTKSNSKILKNGLLEIPVTAYYSIKKWFYSRTDRLDVGMPFSEFKWVLEGLIRHESYNVIVLFAHSFSLINWRRNPNSPCFNKLSYNRMYKQLKHVAGKDQLKYVSLDELLEENNYYDVNDGELLTCKGIKSWLFFLWRAVFVLKSRINVRIRKVLKRG
jgi:peptidoglycan/xylan/chitin deacetylase (PgdA/CDA1 family)